MKLSNRILGINGPGGSDGWEVYYRAREMKAAGQKVINLTVGDHDAPTDPTIIAAMAESAAAGHTRYTAVNGTLELRSAIAARVQKRTGVATKDENVAVTNGGQAALFSAIMALCDTGDTALFIDPYYATYPGTIRAAGAIPHAIPARPEAGFQPDFDALEAAAPRAKLLLINAPNNPTGVAYGPETLGRIVEICKNHDLWLISDEVYDTLDWRGNFKSARAMEGMAERTITLGSLSKSHVMTGFRLGWMVGPEPVASGVMNLTTNTTYGLAAFVQQAGLYAITKGDAIQAANAARYRARAELAVKAFEGSNIITLTPPDGGMFAMLDARATGLSGQEFAHRLLDETGIAVMPGESFGQSAAGHVRVALTVANDELADALQRLRAFGEALAQEKGRKHG